MNTLGAAEITCEALGEVTVRRGLRAKIRGKGAELTQQRVENSGFDYRHVGAGSAPRDPRPLRLGGRARILGRSIERSRERGE